MTEKENPVDDYRDTLQIALESKLEEFKLLGYDRVTLDELWDCLKSKKWKRAGSLRLHQLVNDVLSLSTNDYMTYLTMQAYKAPLWSFDEYEKN